MRPAEAAFVLRLTGLELLEQSFAQGANCYLDAAVAHPGSLLVGLDQASILQNFHMVRNCWLGEFDSLLDVGGGPAFIRSALSRRAGMQQAHNLAPGWIGDGAKRQA